MLSPTSSTQTTGALSAHTPRKDKLRKKLKSVSYENKQLKAKIEDLQNKLSNVEEYVTFEQYRKLTYKFCRSEELANFINIQVAQSQKHPKGRNYSIEFKNVCLAMYYTGPKLYKKILMNLFSLPGPQTLYKLVRGIKVGPGLDNTRLFEMLATKVHCFQDINKHCVLCVDEMSIKANLFYDRGNDYVVGLAENEDGERIFKPSLNVSVLMIRGLYCKWKQPLAYFFFPYNVFCHFHEKCYFQGNN